MVSGFFFFVVLSWSLSSLVMVKGHRRARFDEETGAPLNEAAHAILRRHEEAFAKDASSEKKPGDSEAAFEAIPVVHVAEGTWKYVLLEVALRDRKKVIVRALSGMSFHAENFDFTAAQLRPLGVRCRVIGGGRIHRDTASGAIDVYGYSKTFGRAPGCNERTAAILRDHFPSATVSWSDSGY
mmetsp:Transcript_13374/g.43578  ORF Transcript_13374/g.43578 Transcript_13374/m.43578 type:complete len:183 (-) Transcript_13374:347-895(-)|eukprot:CAMPEP_0118889650 /NCGR_PEP_ID=MMETSP1166-20130328/476_1 /TAXON_ID=1104430 /ORGANISM="Chrysoreinhardia sp, Strain CCMP3193" /LENGTH=182 /DNA_ID=CAMNT_0006828243 /DNA_START=51 /DNA_END=599 /DNA_ORIENTATION=+